MSGNIHAPVASRPLGKRRGLRAAFDLHLANAVFAGVIIIIMHQHIVTLVFEGTYDPLDNKVTICGINNICSVR